MIGFYLIEKIKTIIQFVDASYNKRRQMSILISFNKNPSTHKLARQMEITLLIFNGSRILKINMSKLNKFN
jgi:hypothetical protein